MLQSVVSDVGNEFLRRQRNESEDSGIGRLETGRRQVVLRHRVRNRRRVLVELKGNKVIVVTYFKFCVRVFWKSVKKLIKFFFNSYNSNLSLYKNQFLLLF